MLFDSLLTGTYLDRVDGHQKDSPTGGGRGSAERLDGHGKLLCAFDVVQKGEDSGVGRRVTESAKRALDQRGENPAVESRDASVCVEVGEGSFKSSAVAVLVIDL